MELFGMAVWAMLLITVSVGGFAGGWYAAKLKQKRDNKRLARQMVEAVQWTKGRKPPVPQPNRQRTLASVDNPIRTRQSKVRIRRASNFKR